MFLDVEGAAAWEGQGRLVRFLVEVFEREGKWRFGNDGCVMGWEISLRVLTATSAQSVGFIMALAKRRGTLRYAIKEQIG